MTRRTSYFAIALAFLVVAAGLLLVLPDLGIDDPTGPSTDLDDSAKDRLANEAATRRIALESEAIDARGDAAPLDGSDAGTPPVLAVESVAPPGFEPAPVEDHDPTPPEGYAFSSYHEVTRTPLTADDLASLRKYTTATPEWMGRDFDALADQAAAQGRDWTYGWVKLADGADLTDLSALLTAQGAEAIGQAGDLVRVRMPVDGNRLDAIASAETVAGIGTVPPSDKITDTLRERALADASEEVPVWITLMDDDPDGTWRRELQDLGAVVGQFDPTVRAYVATVPLALLGPISHADYVLGVESIGRVRPTLEIATAAMGADWTRSYDADAGLFTGMGGSAPVGVMDTGLNVSHADIASNRRSICGANFATGFEGREEDQDLWFDFIGHGTAVTGVAVGNGTINPARAGMVPLVQDIRFAKALSSYGGGSALGWGRSLDWFARPTACGDDMPRKALVINSSLGLSADIWESRSYIERKIDASVWAARQLFVTSAGNGEDIVFSSMAGAKNALTVGATQHGGDIAVFSSIGPSHDGRLTPKVVGTGVSIWAARGGGSVDGYSPASGTSFSSPSVVGVAALVMDAVPELKEEPAALRARLMASAIKPDGFMGGSAFPLDNTHGPGSLQNVYGLGKVSARTAILNRDTEDGWIGGSTAFDINPASYVSHDIVVPEGASRLEVVLTWDEPPAETITTSVLHDLDLWVDHQASCGSIPACGMTRSLSTVDNVEWVIISDPAPGVYRLKVTPNRVLGTAPRAGLAWTVIRGDSTPTLSVATNVDRVDANPDEPFEIEVTMSTDGYVAAGANLRVDCRADVDSSACDALSFDHEDSAVHREDGIERNLELDGLQIEVGEIGPGEEQVVTLRFPGQPAGSFQLYLAASAWNGVSGTTTVPVIVGDPSADAPTPIEQPANDEYDAAMVLASEGGETTFDLFAATPGQGEPLFPLGGGHRQRQRSLWYQWTAPDHGLARFTIVSAVPGDYADNTLVEVFRDGPLAGLEAVGTAQLGGGAVFYAERGDSHRIRLSIHPAGLVDQVVDDDGDVTFRQVATPELALKWGPATAPANDHYADATVIGDANGAVTGNNQASTTEPSEFIGDASPYSPAFIAGWAASVWYRWTAPSTGDWRFSVSRRGLAVSVFTGESVADARLVSGAPSTKFPDDAVFPATEGVEYHIAVASASASFAGTEFTLSWDPGERENPGNDDFASAAAAFGDTAFASADFDTLTVEHGEPAESGVRTAWFTWQPPAGGRYTWNAELYGALGDATLQMSVFKGTELGTLEPVAVDVGEDIELRMAFNADADASYAFALGLPRDSAHTSFGPVDMLLKWGATPLNDDLANAILLTGASGSVVGSNEFATNEPGEFSGGLGDSSLWWAIEAEESGWLRFVARGLDGIKLAIYKTGADGSLEFLQSSRSLLDGEVELSFNAEAGVRYLIRLGSYIYDADGFGGRDRGEFELSWSPGAPPARLSFVEVHEGAEVDGVDVGFVGLGNQAFNTDGTELYVASGSGILVFGRDTDTGGLTFMHMLQDYPIDDQSVQLLWDEAGSALLIASCEGWARFTPVEGGGIEPAGEVAGGPCPTEPLMIDGSFVHDVVAGVMIETYGFNDDHTELVSVEQVMIDGVSKAAMTADGSHVYAISGGFFGGSLMAFERDAETGSLSMISSVEEGGMVGEDGTVVEGLVQAEALAVHESHLFVSAGAAGADTAAFDLADPGNPAFVGKIDAFLPFVSFFANCGNSSARHGTGAVDVICSPSSNYAYTVQAGTDSLFPGDLLSLSGFASDAFGNNVPDNDEVYSMIDSPDGRHLYITGFYSAIVFFPEFAFLDVFQMLVFERRLGD